MSIEAQGSERALISILCKNPDKLFSINDIISEADFSNSGSAAIFTIVKDLIVKNSVKNIDAAIIISEAERLGLEDFMKNTLNGDLISAILKQNVNASNLGKFVVDIKQSSIKRALINKCEDLKGDIEEFTGTTGDLRNLVENSILNSISQIDKGIGSEEAVCLSTDFEEVINQYADRQGEIGIDIGLGKWQKDIGYVRNGAITGLFARSKVGKSQFSMFTAAQTAIKQKLPTLYLDTELQARQQQMRLCGILSGISYDKIETGQWKSDKVMLNKIKDAFVQIKGAPLFYKNIAGRSLNSVIPTIRKFVYQHLGGPVKGDKPTGLVIYDYIKLMDSGDLGKNLQEYQVIGLILSSLHDCAAQNNIPILAIGQLNKQEDIGIDRIIHNVDSATILRPKKQEEIELDGSARGSHALEIKYCRNGPGHDFNDWINVHFDKSCGNFKEDKRNSEVSMAVKKLKESDTEKFSDAKEDW